MGDQAHPDNQPPGNSVDWKRAAPLSLSGSRVCSPGISMAKWGNHRFTARRDAERWPRKNMLPVEMKRFGRGGAQLADRKTVRLALPPLPLADG